MTSRNNVSRVLVTEDIEGFGARGCPWLNCVVSWFVRGSVRVWYDALFFKKYVFDSPTRGA